MKNSIGPKIRHPSGTVYPCVIFLKEKHDSDRLSNAAKLYQTILEYPLSKHNPESTFRITDMGYWVLKQNEDYKDCYSGSGAKIRKSIRLDSVSKRIKRYLDNLIKWGLIERVDEVDSNTRNGQKTFLYHFTNMGYIVAYSIQYYNFYNAYLEFGGLQSLSTIRQIKREIFEWVNRLFSAFNSYMISDFLARFYSKCMETDISNNCPFIANGDKMRRIGLGLFDRIILALVWGLNKWNYNFPNAVEYLSAAHTRVLTDKVSALEALRLYFMALDELPDKTRKLVIAHEKAQFENEFVISQPYKDWEEAWVENITKHETLVLYSICRNNECKVRNRPVLMKYRLYREKLVTASKTVNYNDGFPPMRCIVCDCPNCQTRNSRYIFDSFVNVRRFIN